MHSGQQSELTQNELLEQQSENSSAHQYNDSYHNPPIFSNHSREFCEYLATHVKKGDRILDLGCASASLWKHLVPMLPDNISLYGVDLSPAMLDIARDSFPDFIFKEGHFRDIPFPPNSFDVVIVSSAFHHISDSTLPVALQEISRVLEEHGILIGREPLSSGRLGDRGGYTAAVLMNLRHWLYRITDTKELPEPDPGPDHHAYNIDDFISIINQQFTITNLSFRNPISSFLGRIDHPLVLKYAIFLDEFIEHREGSEFWYIASKSYSDFREFSVSVEEALKENKLSDVEVQHLLAVIYAATPTIIQKINSIKS